MRSRVRFVVDLVEFERSFGNKEPNLKSNITDSDKTTVVVVFYMRNILRDIGVADTIDRSAPLPESITSKFNISFTPLAELVPRDWAACQSLPQWLKTC
jgi:hypothetical protein